MRFSTKAILWAAMSSAALAQTACPAYTSGVLASSRIVDWCKNAGLPATLPDAETTPNLWTPPTRTQCGTTVAAGTSFATINTDLAACAAGTYLLLGAGTFSSSTTGLTLGNKNNVTLRGSGADKTILDCSGTCNITFQSSSAGSASYSWTSGLSQGSTSIGFSAAPGSVANDILILYGTSNDTDGGATFVCSTVTTCSSAGGNNTQSQNVLITGCAGSTCTVTPGVYMPNWASQFGTNYNLTVVTNTSQGDGLEDMTLDFTSNTSGVAISMSDCYACWVKGNRVVNGGGSYQIKAFQAERFLIANNYFYGATTLISSPPGSVDMDTDSDGLIINNITQLGTFYWQSGSAGDVVAYNYQRDAFSNSGSQIYAPVVVEHESGGSYILLEGNENGDAQFDDIHGTQNLDTVFRNLYSSNDAPYPAPGNVQAIGFQGKARFMNAVGNVLGSAETTQYQVTPSVTGSSPIYYIGSDPSATIKDTLAFSSSLRWGNWDVVTNATRWCGNSGNPGWSTTCASTSEIPTALTGNAAPYDNPVPSSTSLPASFLMTVSAHPAGGTGLSWWKVCTNYPTCSTSQTQPFPPYGPDVTGGGPVIGNATDIYAGHAYDIPAALAWKDLPIDTSYQSSYAISASSWASGTETLTTAAFPGGFVPKGEFQITGTTGCNGTFVMTAATNTSVIYAAASNPGSCSGGTVKYPDVRTFNETVYQNDPAAGSTGASAPLPLVAWEAAKGKAWR